MRVLVIDDCADAALTMALLLKHYGHAVLIAESGEEGLQRAAEFRPDAIFINLGMPVIDGLTAARQLRETAGFAATPLIAVSGFVDSEHRAQAKAAGFDDFLPKPYSLEELTAALNHASPTVHYG